MTADGARLTLNGRLDANWSDHLGAAVAAAVQAGAHRLLLDMEKVTYISSAGIRVLMRFYKQLAAIGGRLRVVNPSSEVLKVLELSGLAQALMQGPEERPAPAAAADERAVFELEGTRFETVVLERDSRIRISCLGNPEVLRAGSAAARQVSFPNGTFGLGLGALGSSADQAQRLAGELIAACGFAAYLPCDGSNHPDFMLAREKLVPEAHMIHGILGCGGFARQLWVEKPSGGACPLQTVALAALEALQLPAAALIIAAETSCLVGAALRHPCAGGQEDPFAFPAVRERLSFTTEPAFVSSVSLTAGVAGRDLPAALAPFVRPLDDAGKLSGHLHAAAFPYQPLRKGKTSLEETIQRLVEHEALLGILHLVNDSRQPSGAGQSHFIRGAVWCAGIEAAP